MSTLVVECWGDVPSAEEYLMSSKLMRRVQRDLNLSKRNINLEAALEYLIGLYMFPANENEVPWIQALIRPSLYENRGSHLKTLYSKRLPTLSEEENYEQSKDLDKNIDIVTPWENMMDVLLNYYTLPDDAIFSLPAASIGKRQYDLLVMKNATKKMSTMEIILTLMTYYIPGGDVMWTQYWIRVNNSITTAVEETRKELQLISKQIDPQLLSLLLSELRAS